MKKIFMATFFFCLININANAEMSFVEKLRAGKLKNAYPKGYKKSDSFVEDLRSGETKRDYGKQNLKESSKDFVGDLKEGKIKRNYAGKPGGQPSHVKKASVSNNSRPEVQPSNTKKAKKKTEEVKRGKSIRKGFWGR
jgi:hypothetical protein